MQKPLHIIANYSGKINPHFFEFSYFFTRKKLCLRKVLDYPYSGEKTYHSHTIMFDIFQPRKTCAKQNPR